MNVKRSEYIQGMKYLIIIILTSVGLSAQTNEQYFEYAYPVYVIQDSALSKAIAPLVESLASSLDSNEYQPNNILTLQWSFWEYVDVPSRSMDTSVFITMLPFVTYSFNGAGYLGVIDFRGIHIYFSSWFPKGWIRPLSVCHLSKPYLIQDWELSEPDLTQDGVIDLGYSVISEYQCSFSLEQGRYIRDFNDCSCEDASR